MSQSHAVIQIRRRKPSQKWQGFFIWMSELIHKDWWHNDSIFDWKDSMGLCIIYMVSFYCICKHSTFICNASKVWCSLNRVVTERIIQGKEHNSMWLETLRLNYGEAMLLLVRSLVLLNFLVCFSHCSRKKVLQDCVTTWTAQKVMTGRLI